MARRFLVFLSLVMLLLAAIHFTGDLRSRYTFAEELLLSAIAPVQGFFSQVGWRTYHFIRVVRDHDLLLAENEMLRQEEMAQDKIRHQLMELQKENYRLRQMLGFRERVPFTLLPAQVVARNPAHWFETITIDRGLADGVAEDMAVVTAEGLVGNVLKVSGSSAQVLLLTDPRRAVSALIQRTREPGTVAGIVEGHPEEKGYLRMLNIPPGAKLQPGDTVISSGLGGVFSKGLIIGQLVEIGADQYGLLQQAVVRSAVDFNRLEEVFVVTGQTLPQGQDFKHEGL
ncbi:MAG TPA: rod shape-determining protein MreC [Firmicutes bacterium]|nr:rod shape-determining protein MreC [Bacillota bacterium]